MKWIQLISQLLIQYSVQQNRMKEAPEKIKGMSIQAGIVFLGLCFFITLTLSSIVMTFVNLGNQWDAGNGTQFSGPLQAALWMFGLGTLVFVACILWARHLSKQKPAQPPTPTQGPDPINPLTLFGEEFLGQLISKLSQK